MALGHFSAEFWFAGIGMHNVADVVKNDLHVPPAVIEYIQKIAQDTKEENLVPEDELKVMQHATEELRYDALQQLAADNNPIEMLALAVALDMGISPAPAQPKRAMELFEACAKLGYAPAQATLGFK